MGFEQGFALVEVGDVGSSENKAQGVAESVAGEMNFGREAGL